MTTSDVRGLKNKRESSNGVSDDVATGMDNPTSVVHSTRRSVMGIGDWINIISQGADLASKILPLVLNVADKQADATSQAYVLGDISFFPWSGAIYARNDGVAETGVTFAESSPLFTTTEHIVLPVSGAVDVTSEVNQYSGGQVTIAPTDIPAAGANPPITKAIAFTIVTLGLGVASKLLGNASVSVGKTQDGMFGVKFTNTDPMTNWHFKATVKDNKGNSATVSSGGSSRAQAEGSYDVNLPVPAGIDLDPIVQELDVEVQMPAGDFIKATAESRRRVRTMAELGLPPQQRRHHK